MDSALSCAGGCRRVTPCPLPHKGHRPLEVIMFRHIAHTVTSLTLAAIGSVLTLTGVSSARAQAYPTYVAAIPFALGRNNAVFPAGTYQFTSLSQHMLRLDLVGGRRMAFMLSFPVEDATSTH